jgi:hypothetical protein
MSHAHRKFNAFIHTENMNFESIFVYITTDVVCSNLDQGEMYNIMW